MNTNNCQLIPSYLPSLQTTGGPIELFLEQTVTPERYKEIFIFLLLSSGTQSYNIDNDE